MNTNVNKNGLLSIVVPVYNEEKNIPEFIGRIIPLLEKTCKTRISDFEILFVMDPSTDGTERAIELAATQDFRVKLIKLSRRFGQPKATLAGIHLARGEAVVVMDVDLQDPPELVVEMLDKWNLGYDVVYAQRTSRSGETLVKRFVSYVGYRIINRIAEVNIPPNTGDFRLMSRRVVDEIKKLHETHGFLRGMVALVGFKQIAIPFERPARFAGDGNYNRFLGSLRIGLNGIICFSTYTLTLSTQLGFLVAFLSFLIAATYLTLKLTGTPFPIGNPTIVILVLFLGGVQLISVGILGEYIGRIYDEVRHRPMFIIDRAIGLEGHSMMSPGTKPENQSRENSNAKSNT